MDQWPGWLPLSIQNEQTYPLYYPARVTNIEKPIVTPTIAEVSQSQATDAYDVRKTKAKGRSSTIITKPTGVSGDLTLGKPSLLGM